MADGSDRGDGGAMADGSAGSWQAGCAGARDEGQRRGWAATRSLLVDAERALGSVSFEGLDEEELRTAAAELGRLKARADALVVRVAGRMEEVRKGSAGRALVSGVRMSGREARRVTQAARQLVEMPNVGRRLDAGELSLDNLLALGRAAKQCGAATVDSSGDLLDEAAATDAGAFSDLARRFAQFHDPSRGESRRARQRAARCGSFSTGDDGIRVFVGRMDDVSAALFEQAVETHAQALWRRDGGRDGTPDQVRSNRQRLIDSAFELCTGLDALNHRPRLGGRRAGHGGQAGAQLNIVADIGVIDGTDPDGLVEVLGAGPVPASILDTLSPDARIASILFNRAGEPLWLGRAERRASDAQWLAIAVRDRGCVVCRAPMHRCEIHHVDEWERDRGPTDIDNLVALCRSCHRWLHKTDQRIQRTIVPGDRLQWTVVPRPDGGRRGPSPSPLRSRASTRPDGRGPSPLRSRAGPRPDDRGRGRARRQAGTGRNGNKRNRDPNTAKAGAPGGTSGRGNADRRRDTPKSRAADERPSTKRSPNADRRRDTPKSRAADERPSTDDTRRGRATDERPSTDGNSISVGGRSERAAAKSGFT